MDKNNNYFLIFRLTLNRMLSSLICRYIWSYFLSSLGLKWIVLYSLCLLNSQKSLFERSFPRCLMQSPTPLLSGVASVLALEEPWLDVGSSLEFDVYLDHSTFCSEELPNAFTSDVYPIFVFSNTFDSVPQAVQFPYNIARKLL